MHKKEVDKQDKRSESKEKLWHSFTIEKTLEELKTKRMGLLEKEAIKRLKREGPNKLPEEKPLSWLVILLNQFKSPLVYILVLAAFVSFVLREFIDMVVIITAVVLNTFVGFFQENKANRAIAQLKKMVRRQAKIIRDGFETEIDAYQLVPGDLIVIEAGDRVPADARIIENRNLEANEAALTGESVPSNKKPSILKEGTVVADRENMVFMGTTITRGRGKAIVCSVGVRTELGKIACLVKKTKEEKTPLQEKLAHFSKTLGIVILFICFLIFLIGFLTGRPTFEMFQIAVAIAVAAIPEGLLVAVTVILVIGMQRILKEKALVRKLVAAETLGSTTVICTDKTGTLTLGRMQVSQIATFPILDSKAHGKQIDGETEEEREEAELHSLALRIGILCNNAVIENPLAPLKDWKILGPPTEEALLLAAIHAGLDKEKLDQEHKRIDEIPFDSATKFMATLNVFDRSRNIINIKGAPEIILSKSSFVETNKGPKKLSSVLRDKIKTSYEKLTGKGLRVLAVGYKKISNIKYQISKIGSQASTVKQGELNLAMLKEMVFVGLIGLKDPLRPEAQEAVRLCRQAGIRPIMITGDHKLTARAIAREAGIPAGKGNILEGRELDEMADKELKKRVADINVFARVNPHHKLRIIDALQERGEVVAMTGDGVNDAPAIKSADIGLAVGSGTDVAKETADMILLDNNYKTIVKAVEQGRIIFDNIKKVIVYLLSDSFSEMILVSISLFLGLPLPVTAVQILWINLITDGFPSIALTLEQGEKDVMEQKPSLKEKVLDKEMKVLIFIIGIITVLILFGIFYYLLGRSVDLLHLRTIIFTILGIDSLFYVFSCKSLRHSIFSTNIFSNLYLIGAVIAGLGLQLIAIYLPFLQKVLETTPLDLKDWVLVAGVGIVNIIAIEIGKWWFIVKHGK